MVHLSASSLPLLPIDKPEFAAGPDPFLAAAREVHPWLARFSQGYVVHGHEALCHLLADDRHLVPGLGPIIDFYGLRDTMWARFMEEIVISRSGPEHTRLRRSVAYAFTPRRANAERETMRAVITDLLDAWAPRGTFDFAGFASHFPVAVMFGLLGVPAAGIPRIRSAIEDHFRSLSFDPAAGPAILRAWDVLWDFADQLVREREVSGPGADGGLLDALIQARYAGELDDVELRFMVLSVIIAGYDTSRNQLTLTMHWLLDRPDLYARCADDKDFCARVTDESLRYSGIASPFRLVAEDFAHDGFTFRQGETVIMAPALAGRDPAAFPDPLRFDPERTDGARHAAFGRGAHICLGQFIARAQLQEGLHLIAQRLPAPRVAGEIGWRPFLGAWGLTHLPLAFAVPGAPA